MFIHPEIHLNTTNVDSGYCISNLDGKKKRNARYFIEVGHWILSTLCFQGPNFPYERQK